MVIKVNIVMPFYQKEYEFDRRYMIRHEKEYEKESDISDEDLAHYNYIKRLTSRCGQ